MRNFLAETENPDTHEALAKVKRSSLSPVWERVRERGKMT
jgi:hypothetical protein